MIGDFRLAIAREAKLDGANLKKGHCMAVDRRPSTILADVDHFPWPNGGYSVAGFQETIVENRLARRVPADENASAVHASPAKG